MLMQEPTEEMLKEWQDIYNKNKDNLKPNKKIWQTPRRIYNFRRL